MKKALSLILAVMMLLGTLSVTAFAESGYDLYINGVQVTAEGEISNAAITDGTVTYTAAKDGNPAKLTLNGATINANEQAIETYIESDPTVDLEIELIGTNTVTASSADAISIDGNCIITGSGSLTVNSSGIGIYSNGNLTLGMSGTLITTGVTYQGIECAGGINVNAGAGKVIAHSVSNAAIAFEYGQLTGCKTIVGSADSDATDESGMSPVTFSGDPGWITSNVGDPAVTAKTVVLTAYSLSESGSTDITATVANSLSYDMVIPSAVSMTEAGVKAIGTPSVENVKHATEKTVISYTASGTQLTLVGGTATMATSYYTDSEGTALTTDAIKVYENNAVVDPLTTLYVGVTQTDWDDAENGTYKATVTFNFAAEETPAIVTIGDVLATVDGGFPTDQNFAWINGDCYCMCFNDSGVDKLGFYYTGGRLSSLVLSEIVSPVNGGYHFDDGDDSLFDFEMTGGKLTSIVVTFPAGPGNGTYRPGK